MKKDAGKFTALIAVVFGLIVFVYMSYPTPKAEESGKNVSKDSFRVNALPNSSYKINSTHKEEKNVTSK
jgi:hypothetical protein